MDRNLMSLPYAIVEFEQGTAEWLGWRHAGIGASDAPTVMSENPWKSASTLLEEKRGVVKESGQNAAMARGIRLEPEARQQYELTTGNDVRPVCLQSLQHDWLRASLDGLSEDGQTVVEIKCGESAYRKTETYDCVPDYYYGQLQHILAVTGNSSVDFWCWLPGRSGVLVSVERDADYIGTMIKTESRFWNRVMEAG